MKANFIGVTGISAIAFLVLAFASVFEIKLASAQVDASSSLPFTTDTTTVTQVVGVATSTASSAEEASSTPAATPAPDTSNGPTAATSTSGIASPAAEQPPQGLTLVRIVGTKCTDYFTDGTVVTAYPSDPKIDGNLNEPNAPVPSHEGLKWDHTDGTYLYDTPSGNLETGEYAVRPNGSFIEDAAAFVSSTSTPPTAPAETDAPFAAASSAHFSYK
jgi:hypothetical protein